MREVVERDGVVGHYEPPADAVRERQAAVPARARVAKLGRLRRTRRGLFDLAPGAGAGVDEAAGGECLDGTRVVRMAV